MKKVLSLVLAVAMLATMFVLPSVVNAEEADKTNIAENRAAYGSLYQDLGEFGDNASRSSWSYSTLPSDGYTAQLTTDGIIPDLSNLPNQPSWSHSGNSGSMDSAFDGQNSGSNARFNQAELGAISEENPWNVDMTPAGGSAKIVKYSITQPLGNGTINNRPKAWTLQGFDGENWVVLDTFAATQTGALEKLYSEEPFNVVDTAYYDAAGYDGFYYYNAGTNGTNGTNGIEREIANPGTYSQYRLAITAMVNPSTTANLQLALSDIALYEDDKDGGYTNVMKKPFISGWQSTANEDQYVYVDLGDGAAYDSAKLVWGATDYATAYTVSVSDDEENWTEIAKVENADGGEDEISFDAQTARYIKFDFDSRVAESTQYWLYEIEVYGSAPEYKLDELVIDETANSFELTNGNWEIIRSSEVSATGEQLSSAGYTDDATWVPAKVPGTALMSYVQAGAIPHPSYDMDNHQISDLYFYSNFWYRNNFVVPASKEGQNVYLEFDAISWRAMVYFNGHYIDRIDGSYTRAKLDVTEYVNYGGDNYLAVLVIKNDRYGGTSVQSYSAAGSNGGILGADNPSIHSSIGWDWTQTVRGRNIGIYDNVNVTFAGNVQVANSWAVNNFEPLEEDVVFDSYTTTGDIVAKDYSKVTVDVKTEVTNTFAEDKSVVISGTIDDIAFAKTEVIPAGATVEVTVPVAIDNPNLWWPNTYGDQYLYDVTINASVDGVACDSESFKHGVRELQYQYLGEFTGSPGAATNNTDSTIYVYCNGVRIYIRGGNWGMDDSNVDLDYEDYDIRLKMHAAENMTGIRNWVGMTGKEEFWEAADKYGILVYDDFWLANPWDGPDPIYTDMFEANAIDKIKRNRKHASQMLWCARNEAVVSRPIDSFLQKWIEELDGTRIYVRSSNNVVHGISGNGPYTEQERKQYYVGSNAGAKEGLHTERGQHVIANTEVLDYYFREENMWPGFAAESTTAHPWRDNYTAANTWGVHDFFFGGNGPASNFMVQLDQYLPSSEWVNNNSLEDFTTWSQLVNYDLERAMYESHVEERSSGLLAWMSMSAQPSFAWRSFDYFYDASSAFYGIKKASEPLSIIWNPTHATVDANNFTKNYEPSQIAIANNTGKVQEDLSAKLEYYSMNGTLIKSYDLVDDFTADVDTVTKIGQTDDPTEAIVPEIKLHNEFTNLVTGFGGNAYAPDDQYNLNGYTIAEATANLNKTLYPYAGNYSQQYGDERVQVLADGKASTKWCTEPVNQAALDAAPVEIIYKLSEAKVLGQYIIQIAGDDYTRDPMDWKVYGSNDGTTWTELDSVTHNGGQLSADRGQKLIFDVEGNETAYTQYKLAITRAETGFTAIQFAGWELGEKAPVVEGPGEGEDTYKETSYWPTEEDFAHYGVDLSENTQTKFLKLYLYQGEELVTTNTYWRDTVNDTANNTSPDYSDFYYTLKDTEVEMEVSENYGADGVSKYDITLTNVGDAPAVQARVRTEDGNGLVVLPAYYSDNYVILMPDESVTITAEFEDKYVGLDPHDKAGFKAAADTKTVAGDADDVIFIVDGLNFADVDTDESIESTFTVDKDEYVQNETITFTAILPDSVTKVALVTETGKYLGKSSESKAAYADGYNVWTVTTSVATRGAREISLSVSENGSALADTGLSAKFDVVLFKADGQAALGVSAVRAPENAAKNEVFTIDVETSTSTTKVGIFSESGSALGKVSQAYTDKDGVRTWTINIRVGSKGNRSFTVKAGDNTGNWGEAVKSMDIVIG